MKKIIIVTTLILVLASCSLLPKPSTTGQPQTNAVPKAFNLADYDQQAQKELSDWYTQWQKSYDNFSLASFTAGAGAPIQYYSEGTYIDYSANEAGSGAHVVRVKSPDNTKMLITYYGGDPDSGVTLVDLTKTWSKPIANLQCGTPCIYSDGFWLDNERFVVVGDVEDFSEQVQDLAKYGLYYRMPTLYLVDLNKNQVVSYSIGKSVLSSSHSLLKDNLFLGRYNTTKNELQYTIINTKADKPVQSGSFIAADYFALANDVTSYDQNLKFQYYQKTGDFFYETFGYEEMGDKPCINHDKTCDTIIYRKSQGKTADQPIYRSSWLNPLDWLINQETDMLIIREQVWDKTSPDNLKILIKQIDLKTNQLSTLYMQYYEHLTCGPLTLSADNNFALVPCLKNQYIPASAQLMVIKTDLNTKKTETLNLDNYDRYDFNRISPDGNYLAVVRYDNGYQFMIYNLKTLTKEIISLNGQFSNLRMQWSADSKKVAISAKDSELVVYNLETQRLNQLQVKGYPFAWTANGLYFGHFDRTQQYWLIDNNQAQIDQEMIFGTSEPNTIHGLLFF